MADRIDAGPATGTGWRWVIASGALLVAAGVAALLAPALTTITASLFIGWLLLVVGVAGIGMGLRTRRHHDRWADLAYGGLSLAAGGFILFNPLAGALSLTLALACWFGLRGVVELAGAVRGASQGRWLLVVVGMIDLALAVLLLVHYPFPAVQAVGLFVGASLLMAGAVTIATGLQLRRIAGE